MIVPKVTIESPYKGQTMEDRIVNRQYAIECMKDSVSRGEAPYASHLIYTQFINEDDINERNKGIYLGFVWGQCSDYVAAYTDLGISEGMQRGIDYAVSLGKKVEYRQIPDHSIFFATKKRDIIANHLALNLGYSMEQLTGKDRRREVADARFVFFGIIYALNSKISLADIGYYLGRDHATALNGLRQVRDVAEVRQKYNEACLKMNIKPKYYAEASKKCSTVGCEVE